MVVTLDTLAAPYVLAAPHLQDDPYYWVVNGP